MKLKHNLLGNISFGSGLALAVAFAAWLPAAARAAEGEMMHMRHIMTQAQAEALQPGDAMSMTCIKCKTITIQRVTKSHAHVKMMAVGEKVKCSCGGTVEVVATGKGEGKNAEVKHVCSKCGDDSMFCSTVQGSGFYLKEAEIDSR